VWSRDEEVDEHYNAIFRELLTYMMGDPRTINACAHLLFVAKNLERIGDHATNIAEIIHFEITGDEIISKRPKLETAALRELKALTPYVLVVEDEDALATLLHYNLDKEGYQVGVAGDGEEALTMASERAPDLVILDWMLPKVSGIEVCRRLRGRAETRNVPIIMLTARGEESDRIRGLDTGADDYVVKPFSMVELTARVRAVLRRIRPGLADDRITVGDIIIDRVAHRVKRQGKEIHLGPTEFRLLDYLMQHPGRVFSREQLLDAVWGSDVYVEARTVDVHIGRLRKALNGSADGDPIRTVRSAGYSLDVEAA
jgi:two-component system phosphate regulon response regulator PhoB